MLESNQLPKGYEPWNLTACPICYTRCISYTYSLSGTGQTTLRIRVGGLLCFKLINVRGSTIGQKEGVLTNPII